MRLLYESTLYEKYTIMIGQNKTDNDLLITKFGNTDFIWLHLKAYSSCHVVILDNSPPHNVLLSAATACKENTKYRHLKNLKVSYTKYNNVQKTHILGSVNFKSNRQVHELKL
jgi:predicted ribosome quality control (RQC) complex YloA/Tae2 family protein